MTNFKTRIKRISKINGGLILAIDYDVSTTKKVTKTIDNIKLLNKCLCGIKLNFHLLLPLGKDEIKKIITVAHKYNLETIADIKLNDIGNTNKTTLDNLWDFGFDAVIINPIMGQYNIKKIVKQAHQNEKGVITLCHMSSPEAKLSYELQIKNNQKHIKLYQLFLKWAISEKVDGIIVGATFPKIISYCKNRIKGKFYIYSPGIGTQGGNARNVLASGSDFLIVGRSIITSKNPLSEAKNLQSDFFRK